MTPIRRRAPLLAALALLAILAAACGSSGGNKNAGSTTTAAGSASTSVNGKDYKWVMVTDQAGLGDQGFNDLANAGIKKAAADIGGSARAIESSEQAQYVPNLQQAVADKASLIVGVGFLITDALVEVAQQNPSARFVSIDNVAADKSGKPLDNVVSVTFKENEAGYLAGIIAGKTTKTNKIGFAGGLEIPPVVRFLKGFQAGVKSVNPNATINVAYVGGFADAAKTKALAAGYYDAGADIVFEVAGAGGLGAYEEAKSRGPNRWVIGTDTCKDQLAPQNYLTSATKDVAGAVERVAKSVADGTFKGGAEQLGLAEDAVGVCDKTFPSLPQDVQDAVNTAKADIKSGAITVPSA